MASLAWFTLLVNMSLQVSQVSFLTMLSLRPALVMQWSCINVGGLEDVCLV